ncbi:uncharacterized protein B0I36DRAFT_248519 [Microdochium trichocladiopsis]|uniref:Opsin-1 n=1 Tax=Microdochium trichocladiopsis TaxID=1682393 RepID=A0A9P9BQR7_9PEZI|nr:uncharacterized protein B0I36DRAFT_248519 [Microdochium trichocladiopsis]KAH7026157.1 hypothetical protein B0I36DRAFT_248519 [Microdochium trichocladiopsis]
MKIQHDFAGVIEAATKTHLRPTDFPTVIPDIPHVHYQEASETGFRALWVVCVLMGLSSVAFYIMAARVPVQKRLFHVITASITTIAFLSYFAMATGDGLSWHSTVVKTTKSGVVEDIVKRQVFWARYVDWALTTPLLLLDLTLMAGLNGADILVTVGADVIMVLTGLFAAFGSTGTQVWGWYTIACVAYIAIVYNVAFNGRRAVQGKDSKTKAFYGGISLFTLLLWTAYPIVWGIADGSRKIGVDGEILAYAVLDVLAKPVFGFWLLLTHDAMARTSPNAPSWFTQGLASDGAIRVS